MPKKGKRGKKGRKGGKKGKEKKESALKLAAVNSRIWEARLDVTEKSKQEFRENAKRLMLENDALQTQMFQNERDTIDIITFLKKQDDDKDNQLERLVCQMRELQKSHNKDKESIIEDFSRQLNEIEQKLADKTQEVNVLQNELKLVQEFKGKRAQMTRQLEDLKQALQQSSSDHKLTIERMKEKFLDEKLQLQQEANKKIEELAAKAHTEAIVNLDTTTKTVYKENIRLTEALNYHIKESEGLKKDRARIAEELEKLGQEKETAAALVRSKVAQVRHQKETIKELSNKVKVLEKSLGHIVQQFEDEQTTIVNCKSTEQEAAQVELVKLQRVIELQTREMNQVKKLARNILDERTELERFFLLSLEQVKAEIAAHQAQYRKEAYAAYHQKMLTAHASLGEYPKIRNFKPSEHSTNSVFHDIEAANMLYNVSGKVDISELTWEQKERVLRYLFAKMNRAKTKQTRSLPEIRNKSHQIVSMSHDHVTCTLESEIENPAFITQKDPNFELSGLVPLQPAHNQSL